MVAKQLVDAVTTGYGKSLQDVDYKTPDAKMLRNLETNVYQFSAAKNYQQLKDITLAMRDADGNLRNFKDFKDAAQKISFQYNETWLATEYNTAIAGGQMAGRWVDFEANKESMPNLQYVTAGDDRVRPEHEALDGVIKPIDDEFWDTYYPPNDYNCRCDVMQIPGDDTESGKELAEQDYPAINPLFKVNLAKENLVFPQNHPYFKGIKDVPVINTFAVDNISGFKTLKEYKNGGFIKVHDLVNKEADDYKSVYECTDHFAKKGEATFIYPKINKNNDLYKTVYADLKGTIYWGTSPDFRIGKQFYELEGFTTKNPGSGTLKHMIQRGADQSSRIVITNIPESTDRYYKKRLFDLLNQENSKIVVDELWVKDGKELRQVYKKQ